MTDIIDAYLPTATDPVIAAGSGIVGVPAGDRIFIHYEGNLYRSENIKTFADRCHHAADRHFARYPTIARAHVRPESFHRIGYLNVVWGEVHVEPEHLAELAAWLGVEQVDPAELLTSSGRGPELRTVRAWTPAQRLVLRRLPANQRVHYEKAGLI